jgi:hypothetical protein
VPLRGKRWRGKVSGEKRGRKGVRGEKVSRGEKGGEKVSGTNGTVMP